MLAATFGCLVSLLAADCCLRRRRVVIQLLLVFYRPIVRDRASGVARFVRGPLDEHVVHVQKPCSAGKHILVVNDLVPFEHARAVHVDGPNSVGLDLCVRLRASGHVAAIDR